MGMWWLKRMVIRFISIWVNFSPKNLLNHTESVYTGERNTMIIENEMVYVYFKNMMGKWVLLFSKPVPFWSTTEQEILRQEIAWPSKLVLPFPL